ncbi:MAG: efflux RND transporter periplasmic adaptor subunit [Candidatus Aminicenantes bacterium]|jgi:membrane fusion protein (multidrug efflux system)|nr:efflux RND transporter periplasmic adaptor subunit [Candidatus Aminicenantes bacterium]
MGKKFTKKQRFIALSIFTFILLVVLFLWLKNQANSKSQEEQIVPEVAVEVGQIIKTTLHRYVPAYGHVEPEPPAEGRKPAVGLVSSPVGGILTEILVREGQRVDEGQVIFKLDSRMAEIDIIRAKKELEFARQNYERQKKLLETQATSEKSLKEAETQLRTAEENLAAAQTKLSYLQIKSPLRGLLTRINVQLGQVIDPNAPLAEVIDLNRLVITGRVPSSEVSCLQPGQKVDLTPALNSFGTLIYVSKDIDPSTDTILVRVQLPAGSGLLPGTFLQFKVVAEEHQNCLAIPIASLVSHPGEGESIFIVEGLKARRIPVTSGLRDQGLVEIKGDGLKAGMAVVTTGAYALPDEVNIRIIEK